MDKKKVDKMIEKGGWTIGTIRMEITKGKKR